MTCSRRSIDAAAEDRGEERPGRQPGDQQDQVDLLDQTRSTSSARQTTKYTSPSRVQDRVAAKARAPSSPWRTAGAGARRATTGFVFALIDVRPPPSIDRDPGCPSAPLTIGTRKPIDDVADDRLGRAELARLEERLAHDPVRQHGDGQGLDVVGDDVIRGRRPGPGSAQLGRASGHHGC